MNSEVVHVLIRIILSHRSVFQKRYDSLKMAQCRSKVASALFIIAFYLRTFVAMGVRHIATVKAQVKLYSWERRDRSNDFSEVLTYQSSNPCAQERTREQV